MSEILKAADAAVRDYVPGHSTFQIEHFMIAGGGTPYGKWRQCQREIVQRRDSAKKEDEVAARELQTLLILESELRAALVAEHGELTADVVSGLEWQAWRWRIRRELALDFYTTGQPQRSTLESILLMPEDIRTELLDLVKQSRPKMSGTPLLSSWVENGASVDGMPALPAGGA